MRRILIGIIIALVAIFIGLGVIWMLATKKIGRAHV